MKKYKDEKLLNTFHLLKRGVGTMAKLNAEQIAVYMRYLSQWEDKEQSLEKTFRFQNDEDAIRFVSLFCEKIREIQHIPEMCLKKGEVRLKLYTLDPSGPGITGKDFALAMAADQIFRQFASAKVL